MAILQEEKSKKNKNKQKLNLFSTFEISTVLRKNKNGMNLVLKKWSQCEYHVESKGAVNLHLDSLGFL